MACPKDAGQDKTFSEIVDFLQGKESAEQALADVEAAYITVAKEKGFL